MKVFCTFYSSVTQFMNVWPVNTFWKITFDTNYCPEHLKPWNFHHIRLDNENLISSQWVPKNLCQTTFNDFDICDFSCRYVYLYSMSRLWFNVIFTVSHWLLTSRRNGLIVMKHLNRKQQTWNQKGHFYSVVHWFTTLLQVVGKLFS